MTPTNERRPTKVVLAGGAGALGRRMAESFTAAGADVVILSRHPRPDIPHRQLRWDGRTVGPWAEEMSGAIVVNLAGEIVDRRPTKHNIDRLRRSRVEPTRALVEASMAGAVPALWLQMSTLAIYGDAGDTILDEDATAADGPPQMAGVATAWEAAVHGARAGRLVILRTGIVLDRDTPALRRLTQLTRLGLGGRISRGDQWVSWLHVADFLGIVDFIVDSPTLDGVLHLTAPEPVPNKDLMRSLRQLLHRPASPPTPRPLVHVGAWLMGTDPGLALTGRRCVPRRLRDAGYRFRFPTVHDALVDLIDRPPTAAGPA
jgi:uncharacterized protein (TIGR01777 family)